LFFAASHAEVENAAKILTAQENFIHHGPMLSRVRHAQKIKTFVPIDFLQIVVYTGAKEFPHARKTTYATEKV
jgi:hypothetical protein